MRMIAENIRTQSRIQLSRFNDSVGRSGWRLELELACDQSQRKIIESRVRVRGGGQSHGYKFKVRVMAIAMVRVWVRVRTRIEVRIMVTIRVRARVRAMSRYEAPVPY